MLYVRFVCSSPLPFRSSDSTKYGTNKSSGTSVTSGHYPPNYLHSQHQQQHQQHLSHHHNQAQLPTAHGHHSHHNHHNHQSHSFHQQHHPIKSGSLFSDRDRERIAAVSSAPHESVSSRKPPVHPNHPNQPATVASALGGASVTAVSAAAAAATTLGGSRQSIVAPVHSSNNRLFSNITFQNNQYSFSLSRDGAGGANGGGGGVNVGLSANGLDANGLCAGGFLGGGTAGGLGGGIGTYLDPPPLMTLASPYACPAGRASRATKSDIGLSGRRPSTSSSSTNGGTHSRYAGRSSSRTSTRSHCQQQQHQPVAAGQPAHRSSNVWPSRAQPHLPTVKSDFLLSYLSQSSQLSTGGGVADLSYGGGGGIQPATSDYLEHYKAESAALRMFPRPYSGQQQRSSSSRSAVDVTHAGIYQQPPHVAVVRTQPQRATVHHQANTASTTSASSSSAASAAAAAAGPLLYLDSAETAERAMSRHQHHLQQQQKQQQPSINGAPIVSTSTAFAQSTVQSTSSASTSLVSSTACHRNVLYQHQHQQHQPQQQRR